MKKIIMIVLILVIGIVGIIFIKNGFSMRFDMSGANSGYIILTNDSSDGISVEYKQGDKNIDIQVPAQETVPCGNNGFVRVFTAKKSGSYELEYPNDSRERSVRLSQIIATAKKDMMDNEVYIKTGMLGDIKITYEEVQEVGD